jgi:hypothetical protein
MLNPNETDPIDIPPTIVGEHWQQLFGGNMQRRRA